VARPVPLHTFCPTTSRLPHTFCYLASFYPRLHYTFVHITRLPRGTRAAYAARLVCCAFSHHTYLWLLRHRVCAYATRLRVAYHAPSRLPPLRFIIRIRVAVPTLCRILLDTRSPTGFPLTIRVGLSCVMTTFTVCFVWVKSTRGYYVLCPADHTTYLTSWFCYSHVLGCSVPIVILVGCTILFFHYITLYIPSFTHYFGLYFFFFVVFWIPYLQFSQRTFFARFSSLPCFTYITHAHFVLHLFPHTFTFVIHSLRLVLTFDSLHYYFTIQNFRLHFHSCCPTGSSCLVLHLHLHFWFTPHCTTLDALMGSDLFTFDTPHPPYPSNPYLLFEPQYYTCSFITDLTLRAHTPSWFLPLRRACTPLRSTTPARHA